MKFQFAVLVLAIVASANVKALPTTSLAQANSDSTLINYLLQSQTSTDMYNTDVTSACFAQYLPQLNKIATTFSTTYEQCQTVADNAITALIATTQTSRTTFTQEISQICTAYQSCNEATDVSTFFNCYATESSKDASVIYNLSNSASSAATSYSEGLTKIQDTEKQCTSDAEQAYVTSTGATYKLLDNCLAGIADGTSTTAIISTTEPNTSSLPTTAPATTTTARITTTVANTSSLPTTSPDTTTTAVIMTTEPNTSTIRTSTTTSAPTTQVYSTQAAVTNAAQPTGSVDNMPSVTNGASSINTA